MLAIVHVVHHLLETIFQLHQVEFCGFEFFFKRQSVLHVGAEAIVVVVWLLMVVGLAMGYVEGAHGGNRAQCEFGEHIKCALRFDLRLIK